jgi:outer membrane receptor for ferrienterochelin and colicin
MNISSPLHNLTALCLCLTLQTAAAQEADQSADGEDSTLTYPAAFFAQYSPVSVNDMLDRIPGIQLVLDFNESSIGNNADRGLGATSQILIDGRRLAGKANEAQNQLNRIAATEVDYIEIVRGSSSSLDVQNTGTLVNIVLLEAQSRSSLSTEVGMRHFTDGNVEPEARLSLTGQRGRFNYLVSGDMNPGYRIEETLELSIYPDESFNEIVNLERKTDQTNYNFNANMSWDFTPRDRLALNALFAESDPPQTVLRRFTDFNGESPTVRYQSERNPASAYNWEIGGDYQHTFANNARYKFLFIVNDKIDESTRQRFDFQNPGDPEIPNLFLDTERGYSENIVRTSYTWNVAADHGLELGVEWAKTTQDSALRLGLPIPGEGSPDFGGDASAATERHHHR